MMLGAGDARLRCFDTINLRDDSLIRIRRLESTAAGPRPVTPSSLLSFDLSGVRRKKLTRDFSGGNQSSNGGLPLLRSAERKLGVCGRLADAMPDRRDASRIRHAMFEMVMARVCAIACATRMPSTSTGCGMTR